MIRVMIVDDHELVRLGIRSYLQSEADMEIVAEAANGDEAIALATSLEPDVILMDVLMPGKSGVEATEALVAAGTAARIVMLTSSLDDRHVIDAMRAGALSYLLKTSTAITVAAAVRAAYVNQPTLDAVVQRSLVDGLRSPANVAEQLTEREQDVLRAIARGRNNQEIADDLHIGVKTVKTHVSNILAKLGVLDRTQAAIFAIRNHLD